MAWGSIIGTGIDLVGDVFGGEDNPPNPPPIQTSVSELTKALDFAPSARDSLRGYMVQEKLAGEPPNLATMSEIQRSTSKLAEQAIFLANGAVAFTAKGEGFTPKEQEVRRRVESILADYRYRDTSVSSTGTAPSSSIPSSTTGDASIDSQLASGELTVEDILRIAADAAREADQPQPEEMPERAGFFGGIPQDGMTLLIGAIIVAFFVFR